MRRSVLFASVLTMILALVVAGFAQKPYAKNRNLEINDLKTESQLRTLTGKVGASSHVEKYAYNEDYGPLAGTPEQMAREYLNIQGPRFGLKNGADDLNLVQVATSPGGSHVRLRPTVNNIPVYAADIVVTINNDNKVSFVASANRPELALSSTGTSVSRSQAMNAAVDYIGVTGKVIMEPNAELYVFESKTRGAVLAWRVITVVEEPMGDWEVFVHASTGEILHVKNQMMHQSKADGSGMVFEPDPLTTAGVTYGGFYSDNNDTDVTQLNDERVSVTLRDLNFDGTYYSLSGPYCVLSDLESPTDAFPQLTDPNGFNYTRAEQGFEDVNVYYHIDLSYRTLDALGFSVPGLLQFQSDPHGLNGDDNAHYVPSANYCAWGEGGVDDAEDADVIWHEYGHAIQTNTTGGMSYSGETMSLQEGSSDYWATSYSRTISEFGWERVFTWDGHNEFWAGRFANLDWVYPDDYVSGHNGGQIWNAALMQIWQDLGREVTDKLFIQAHYIWGYSPTLQDAAAAFIQADRDLYGGSHLSTIVYWFDLRGLVNGADYIPTITHTPLADSEDVTGPYEVTVNIVPGVSALDPNGLKLVYGYAAKAPTDTLDLVATGNANEYSASIPGPGYSTEVQYYLSVVDSAANYVVMPSGAPANYYAFAVGPDTEAPVIAHGALSNQAYIRWPAKVVATVTDNIGIADVTVNYYVNSASNSGSFTLTDDGNGVFSGFFDIDTTAISIGDSVSYRITATDASSSGNVTNEPAAGFHTFHIIETRGIVLVINDDPAGATKVVSDKGTYERNKDAFGASADYMVRWLSSLGFVAEQATVAEAMAMNWDDYDVIISSSGANTSPVADAAYRTALETWAADPAHKYIIEGGEVGYDAASSPGYPTFADNVIHSNDWDGDDSGAMPLAAGYEAHPVATTPNALPTSLSLNYVGYGDQDSQKTLAGSYAVYGTTDEPVNAGISVYDDNPNPQSAQSMYYAFNLAALADTVAAKNLLENSLEYLLTTEAAATGSIAGNVNLSDNADNSGVTVTLTGLVTETVTTDASGDFSFTGLYAGTYAVTVSKDGYFPYSASTTGIEVADGAVTGIDFTLDPVAFASISGTVTLFNETDYSGVTVEVLGQGLSVQSAANGAFYISGVAPGDLEVSFSKTGYVPAIIDTFMANGTSLSLSVELQKDLAGPGGLQAESGLEFHVPLSWLLPGSLEEGFENGIPADWNILNLGANTTTEGWHASSTAHTGAQGAMCDDGGIGEDMDEWLITNSVSVSAANPYLHYWHYAGANTWDNAPNYIKVSTSSNSDTSTFVTVKTYPVGSLPTAWTEDVVDLTAYVGQSIYIAFQYTSNWGEFWYLDDVSLQGTAKTAPAVEETPVIAGDLKNGVVPQHIARIQSDQPSQFGQVNKEFLGFNVYRSESAGVAVDPANLLASVATDVVTYDDSSVVNGTTYYYVVASDFGADGMSQPSNEVSATPENWVPDAPANFAAALVDSVVTFTWDAVTAADLAGYKVYGKAVGGDYAELADVTETTFEYTLPAEGIYSFYSTAYDNGSPSLESDASNVETVAYGKIPPANLAAESGRDSHVPLTWSAPGGGAMVETELLYDDGTNEAGGIGFNGGTGYFASKFTVGSQTDILSAKVQFTTQATPGDAFDVVVWEADASGLPGSVIHTASYVHDGPYDEFELFDVGATSTSGTFYVGVFQATVNNVSVGGDQTFTTFPYVNNTFYYSSDGAVWNTFESIPLTIIPMFRAVVQTAGKAPVEVSASIASLGDVDQKLSASLTGDDTNVSTVGVDHSKATGRVLNQIDTTPLSYNVYRSESSPVAIDPANLVANVDSSMTEYDDAGVTNYTTYYYVVTALYAEGESGASNEASATPAPLPSPVLSVTDSTNAVSLSWTDILKNSVAFNKRYSLSDADLLAIMEKGADSFNMYKSDNGTDWNMMAEDMAVTNYTDSDVLMGHTYWYYVTAVLGGDESAPSNIVSATVVGGASEIELVYDDGDASSGYYWADAGTGSGNRMSPPGMVQILSAKFYMRTPAVGSNTFMAKIFSTDISGAPDAELGSVPVTGAADNDWAVADFSSLNITTNLDFIVFMEYDGTNQPVYGFDPVDNGRAWDYDPAAGGWAQWNETYFMRAVVAVASGIEMELGAVPTNYALDQNYPNPFNPETTIKYQLPKAGQVKLTVFNMLGQKVRTLVNDSQVAGYYQVKWDGHTEAGQQVSSGVYYYRIEADGFVKTHKMLLLK